MRKKSVFSPMIIIMLLVLSLMGGMVAQAGTKDMDATRRTKFKDDSVESMRDVFDRKEAEEKAFRQTMLSNSNKTVELLSQVRDLLIKLNEKK